jgi:hypothetical protein
VPEMEEVTPLEPETTGSIERGRPRAQRTCNRFAFHLHDPPGEQFREAC